MSIFSNFQNLYGLSKTLRFELIPQGETLDFIQKNGILSKDESRAESYKIAKKIIDEYHKDFINKALEGLKLSRLDEYFQLYKIQNKDEYQKKQFEEIQAVLRKHIADRFSKHPDDVIKNRYKNLFGKELIKIDLKEFVTKPEELKIVNEFENFTTYFTGFHENRANMYTHEDKSTAISFRLINQNLPKFIDNQGIFEKVVQSPLKNKFPTILKDLNSILQVNNIEEMFHLESFNETLNQLGIDRYNYLLGGYTSDDGKTKIQGLNEHINLYNQQVLDKKDKIAKLKPLFKQILSDRNTTSFLPEEFRSDAELLESIEKFYQEVKYQVLETKNNEIITLPELLRQITDFDLSKIYIRNDLGLTDISQKMFGNWTVIQDAIYKDFAKVYKGKAKQGSEKYEEEQSKHLKRFDSFSIQYLNETLILLENPDLHKNIADYFVQLSIISDNNEPNLFESTEKNYSALENILKAYPDNQNLIQDQQSIDKIKTLLDNFKQVQRFIKPLLGKGNEAVKDEKFYSEFEKLWETLDQVTPLYNKVRNYVTKKPYSLEKIKLNFENSTLLDGWDVNKEEANASILLRKNDNYYLGIMDRNHNKVFRDLPESKTDQYFQKVNYKLLPGASKMLPKVFFSGSNIDYFKPNENILRIRNHGSHTKNGKAQEGYEKEDFEVNDCREIIDFYKDSLVRHNDWKHFGFKFRPTNEYNSIDEFYSEVENQGYSITYTNIDDSYISELVHEGKLYLFKIYNKDFSGNSKGTPNLHTLYWKMVFDPNNLENVVYKLNGQAEIFFRKKSIKEDNIFKHLANQTIPNKNELNTKKQSLFVYDIIKDRRFTIDKFQFHVPITMNFKADGYSNINTIVNQAIKENQIKHIIGIDRGERHLLYITVIDLDGKIKEQFSLNEIVNNYNGNEYKTDYHSLLDKREGGRDESRKNWKTIETIKELKEGYISQVIHRITELIIQYNAIVVLEDLNMGFMRGRQKVEKQVYQKFEKMLIDKLNYLVDKKKEPTETGGLLNALQLTNPFVSFHKIGKQSGFLFYIPAWNTSKMDPVTGFVNLFQIKYENVEKARSFLSSFSDISYNSDKKYFEFSFDYSLFTNKAEGTRTHWVVCTYGNRIKTQRNPNMNNQWVSNEINITNEFITLFSKYKIDYNQKNLKVSILSQTDKGFYESILHLFKLTLQMRNSIANSNVDYLISPVEDDNGKFFFSETASNDLPQNADANGAFNIARKGLWVIEQIKKSEDFKKLKLAITNKEWLNFAQK
ncbi:MAG: type V CRISPR-associated protein Cas12a/Cpf1 [Bacteroidota bacterium]|nr:type V CRISPR-associated protein Cas12a/Cpf1 [Bacteroidota bacterium]